MPNIGPRAFPIREWNIPKRVKEGKSDWSELTTGASFIGFPRLRRKQYISSNGNYASVLINCFKSAKISSEVRISEHRSFNCCVVKNWMRFTSVEVAGQRKWFSVNKLELWEIRSSNQLTYPYQSWIMSGTTSHRPVFNSCRLQLASAWWVLNKRPVNFPISCRFSICFLLSRFTSGYFFSMNFWPLIFTVSDQPA